MAIYTWRHIPVAVKEMLPAGVSLDKDSLLREVSMFVKAGRHPHVLAPLGICTDKPGCGLMLVMPFCRNGTLKTYVAGLEKVRAE